MTTQLKEDASKESHPFDLLLMDASRQRDRLAECVRLKDTAYIHQLHHAMLENVQKNRYFFKEKISHF